MVNDDVLFVLISAWLEKNEKYKKQKHAQTERNTSR